MLATAAALRCIVAVVPAGPGRAPAPDRTRDARAALVAEDEPMLARAARGEDEGRGEPH